MHERYKDLALVEQAFRTSKTVQLEMRPIHVRREASTRGHALVVMLAYRLAQELAQRWREVDLTVQPSADLARLIELARVTVPKILRRSSAKVATKKKLPENRARR